MALHFSPEGNDLVLQPAYVIINSTNIAVAFVSRNDNDRDTYSPSDPRHPLTFVHMLSYFVSTVAVDLKVAPAKCLPFSVGIGIRFYRRSSEDGFLVKMAGLLTFQ